MQKCILMILDGYGEGETSEFNAVKNAYTPFLDNLHKKSYSLLETSGEDVGLFDGEMGGSEVGHTTIGAGRIVRSTAKLINDEIISGAFEKQPVIKNLKTYLKNEGGNLHLFGLMSDKNIHSNIYHCLKLVDIYNTFAKNVFIHFVTDGRDSGGTESIKYYKILKDHIKNISNCHVLSVSGRFYSMDRENHQERIDRAFKAMFNTKGQINESDIEDYLTSQHEVPHNDQYVEPIHVENDNYSGVKTNDCIFLFNFREDRLRQIGKVCENFKCPIISMSNVGGVNTQVVYPVTKTDNTLSEYISNLGLRQVKISETTKYAHVTYFLNGGEETPFKNEDRVHLASLDVADFSATPQMKAEEIANEVFVAMEKEYDAIIVNFSNPDMIGHTGNYEATVKALEILDDCVKRIVEKANEADYVVLITADHGNAETMRTENGEPQMAHTLNPVFCVVANREIKLKKHGGLRDVAPTFVELLGLKKSSYFEGESLIIK